MIVFGRFGRHRKPLEGVKSSSDLHPNQSEKALPEDPIKARAHQAAREEQERSVM